ncbi:MAG: hypothetical protein HC809_11910, partial [Gammaproteobacteria bacterium]|nr:hypothetical protein [Gammaproteobacteria bacterium]
DMASTGHPISKDELERLHDAKTGALLTVAVELGALAANASVKQLTALTRFGQRIGRAFQVVDDLLDVTQSTATQGKRAGADARLGKNTFPGLMGVAESRAYASRLHQDALAALAEADIHTGALRSLADQIVARRS